MAPAGSSHIDFTLAVLTAAGGIMGYVKSRSVPSVSAIGESLCAIGAIGETSTRSPSASVVLVRC